MLYLNLTLSVITQNVKLLSSTLKDYTQTTLKDNTQINRMDKRTKSTMYYIEVMQFRFKDTNKLKMKGWKMIHHANSSQKKAGRETLILQDRL